MRQIFLGLCRLFAVITAVVLFLPNDMRASSEVGNRTSRHMSQVIREGFYFQKDGGTRLVAKASASIADDDDVLRLPDMRVSAPKRPKELTPDDVATTVEPAPVMGTGVTVIEGRKASLEIHRVLFLPTFLKLRW